MESFYEGYVTGRQSIAKDVIGIELEPALGCCAEAMVRRIAFKVALILSIVAAVFKDRADLVAENIALRHQLSCWPGIEGVSNSSGGGRVESVVSGDLEFPTKFGG